ncbi:pimeloyl-ACP methyl ester carboxylesterase [Saccharopolyspora erythraea NRRL 2338]|uniref:Alpha/beta hydrolase n=2 Tax=Saccharopolyspora erythraea TaxID=1836 RepID=A0ABP3NPA1_SACER|nr:alpha/beta hydrolase [Saccharopolyspora erythraea]EQD83065.1 alpha/beta hydrolase [Saccharopolyspora erythraea D]PFG99103.1 pimeloyl-ACP methyl ester carboxylesterase [Saccharopolyspora erythraea NRRL 2338]QRK89063.1 alpha/beta hydrolase [Saccharopolyspora erythraea]CAM05462.1 similar to hydrolase or acyltransferase (alpha/beta hydrolase superfamily) [Saccharopolyspora erythraea NRRL 2338]
MTALPQGVETDHIEFPAGKIRFHRAGGSGPAIVLLHGGGVDNGMLSWRHTVPVLAVDHTVFVPDLPGQGGSRPWHGRADQRTCEEALRWLLDAWRVPDATVVGMSMGGSIATGFALRHPQRVRGLVLAAPTGMQARLDRHLLTYLLVKLRFPGMLWARAMGMSSALTRWVMTRSTFTGSQPAADLESILDEVRAEVRSRGTVFSDWQHGAIDRRSMRINHLPHLDRIRCPTMVIHGEKDGIVPMPASQEAARAIPGAMFRWIADAGHWPSREKPNEFNALLREFVNAHP